MNLEEIRKHWEALANQFGKDLKATTKTSTAKAMEIDAFFRAFKRLGFEDKNARVLEVGCGNGHNCLSLAAKFPKLLLTGIDYIPEMVANANSIKDENQTKNTQFFVGNVLELEHHPQVEGLFDIVFTNRCLINLNSNELQIQALEQITKRVRLGGYFFFIENSKKTHEQQNHLRVAMGLDSRKAADYNLFIDEDLYFEKLKRNFEQIEVEDFISLHDLVLYVLVPMINGGKIEYEHPAVLAATKLSMEINQEFKNPFGPFGQNRLYVFKKTK